MRVMFRKYLFLFVCVIGCLWGCAAPKERVDFRFFWPPLPASPKIEWIGSYRNRMDFNKYGKSFWGRITGQTTGMSIKRPWGIAADSEGRVYVADTALKEILVFDMVAEEVYIMGNGRFNNLFTTLLGVAVDASGNIYASDAKNHEIYVFTKDHKALLTIGDETILNWPAGLAVDDKRNRLYVVNNHNHNIAVFDLGGKHLFDIGKRGGMPGYFNYPTDVDIDSRGNILVADSMNARVQILSPEGEYLRHFGRRGDGICDFEIIKGIAVDKTTDNIYVADGKGHDFKIFNTEGECLLSVGGAHSVKNHAGEAPGGFLLPQDMDIDEKGNIYIVDSMNKRFQVYKIVDEEWLREKPIKED